jgi:type IV pilus assembly protein PilM
MPTFGNISRLVQDPPPEFIFELSEAGIAYSRGLMGDSKAAFEPLEPGALVPSPVDDNLLRADRVAEAVERISGVAGAMSGASAAAKSRNKPRRAALILPDPSARVSVLDFDSFPTSVEEQQALVRFRVKKTVPFDIDSAAVSYYPQAVAEGKKKKFEVVVVSVALEVLARYEALFRTAGFHTGEVTTSALAALNLYSQEGPGVIAKLAGNVLTVMVVVAGRLRLFRCLALEEASEEEILGVLHPTLAYAEDELGAKVVRLTVYGFDHPPSLDLGGTHLAAEPLRSRLGAPGAFNAGLLGYLEGKAN